MWKLDPGEDEGVTSWAWCNCSVRDQVLDDRRGCGHGLSHSLGFGRPEEHLPLASSTYAARTRTVRCRCRTSERGHLTPPQACDTQGVGYVAPAGLALRSRFGTAVDFDAGGDEGIGAWLDVLCSCWATTWATIAAGMSDPPSSASVQNDRSALGYWSCARTRAPRVVRKDR
jgi:hypothetical protein